ncbi:FAD-dependent monooxygenase [Paenibacillus sp. tmac-D7]|uniref:FAD-dependent monooxygenase n=1 Tax=Paenibacillus sp. tmac-D7 TaxID=2591462 RepID=UPI001141279C|nr:FAD-dependent monooxygenase [Paenibacillus sp. tmac-D7]
MTHRMIETDVCVAGGGPAGLFVGLLLAKAGVRVTVLESHDNFDREYRGEVLQPRFLQLLQQLNLRDYIESFPGAKVRQGTLFYKNKRMGSFSFEDVSGAFPYALWMPQPVLLQALYDKARTFPSFEMLFHAPVKQLLHEGDRIAGVVAETADGPLEVRARLTVGADGRFSAVRKLGGFEIEYEHYAGDLVWFTVPKPADWGEELRMLITDGHGYIVLPKYPNLLQVGIAVPAAEWKEIKAHGIEPLRQELLAAHPAFRDFAESLTDFKPFVLLQAKDFYVREWAKNGCLLVGDAAHCASPAGAVGVSLSVTTAVVAADVIYDALRDRDCSAGRLAAVQKCRDREIRSIHSMQDRAAKLMFSSSPFIRTWAPMFISFAAKTKLIRFVQRRLLVLPEPLAIHERFMF